MPFKAEHLAGLTLTIDDKGIVFLIGPEHARLPSLQIGDDLHSLFVTDEHKKFDNHLSHCISHKESSTFESVLRAKDDYLFCFIKLTPLYGKRKQLAVLEILEKNEANSTSIRGNFIQRSFASIIKDSPDYVYVCNFEGYFQFMNKAGLDAVKVEEKEISKYHFTDFVRKDYMDQMVEFYQNQFSNRIKQTYKEFPVSDRSGESFWVGQKVTMIKEGDWVVGFHAVVKNIDDRIRLEKEIKQKKNVTNKLTELLPGFKLFVNKDGVCTKVYSNSEFPEFEQFDFENHKLAAFIQSREQQLKLNSSIQKSFEGGIPNITKLILQKDQKEIEVSARPIAVSDTECLILFYQDKKPEILAASDKEKFLSNLNYEFRTPLNNILGLTDLLDDIKLPNTANEYVKGIKYSGNNLLKSLDTYAHHEGMSSYFFRDPSNLNISKLLKELESEFQVNIQQSNTNIQLEVDDAVSKQLYGDSALLKRILSNVLQGVFSYLSDGEILLKVFNQKIEGKEHTLKFRVQDTSSNFPEKQLSLLQSEDKSLFDIQKRPAKDWLIAKKLVEFLGNKMKIRHTPSDGTVISFEIQFEEPDSGKKPRASQLQYRERLEGVKILLAEDDIMNQLIISDYLSKFGAKTETAHNGKEALDKILNNTYDLVLIDLKMPVLTGFEVIKSIRNKSTNFVLPPIIAISASADETLIQESKNLGFADYLIKPVDLKGLTKKIRANLFKRSHGLYSKDIKDAKFNLVNLKYLQESSLNDKEYMIKMLKIFLKNTPQYLNELKYHQEKDDLQELKKIAHKYKASVNIMGIKKVEILINTLENYIKTNSKLNELSQIVNAIIIFSYGACSDIEFIIENWDDYFRQLNEQNS